MTDPRELIQWCIDTLDADLYPEETARQAVIVVSRLREWLATPEPAAGPTDEEVEAACPFDSFQEPAQYYGWHLGVEWAEEMLHQPPQPIPLSERLPGPEDCDVEGRYWRWDNVEGSWFESVYHSHFPERGYWLPHRALPRPEAP